MQSAQEFLLAAKNCEIAALEQLGLTCKLVGFLGELIHQLQRERGASNVYLGSGGQRFAPQLSERILTAQAAESRLRHGFSNLTEGQRLDASCMRLFSRIAYVLHSFEVLAELRRSIAALEESPTRATQAYTRLIAALLGVVFEAADAATDPEITRLLVSLFNLLHGKEFAGQERALGATGFSTGFFDGDALQGMQHVQEAQHRCFEVFYQFATPEAQSAWQQLLGSPVQMELLRLRQLVQATSMDSPVPCSLSEAWYELTSCRIDQLHEIERQLTRQLKQLARTKQTLAYADLCEHQNRLKALEAMDQQTLASLHLSLMRATGINESLHEHQLPSAALAGISPLFSRSVFDLIHAQAQRLQSMQDQLDATKKSLQERKLVERAKGLLMTHRNLSEDQAYRLMRQAAMEQHCRLVEVAETLIGTFELLSSKNAKTTKRVPL